VLTLGNYNRTLTSRNGLFGTGLHLYLPLGIEKLLERDIVPDTMDLDSQSLTTLDNCPVTVETVIKFRIYDVKTFLLDITDQESALTDICSGIVGILISEQNYTQLVGSKSKVQAKAIDMINEQVSQYGVEIMSVVFKTLQKCRTIRLINDAAPLISV